MSSEQSERIEYTKTALQQLIALIINQDHVARGSMKFLIVIETALFATFFSLSFQQIGKDYYLIKTVVLLLIAIGGIAAAVILTNIIIIERKWQAWYVQQVRYIQADIPPIFPTPTVPEDRAPVAKVEDLRPGFISCWIKVLMGVVVAIWLVAIVIIFATMNLR